MNAAHPLYRSIAALSRLTKRHPALRDGVQQERYADDGPGVYAFSRTDLKRRVEYVVAVNNAERARSVEVPTYAAGMDFRGVYGSSARVTSGGDRKISVVVPPLSAVVLKAARPLAFPAAGPSVTLRAPAAGATGDVEIAATVDGGQLNRVVFVAQVGGGPWRTLGSADHAPYKVTQHLPDTVRAGTVLRYKAVVVDSAGRTASATATTTAGRPPVAERPTAKRQHAVVHHRRADGDYDGLRLRTADGTTARFIGRDAYGAFAWITPGTGTGTIRFTIEKDGVADETRARLRLRRGRRRCDRGEQRGRPQGPAQGRVSARRTGPRPSCTTTGPTATTRDGACTPGPDPRIRPSGTSPSPAGARGLLRPGLRSAAQRRSRLAQLHPAQEGGEGRPGRRGPRLSLYGHEVWRVAGDPAYLTPSPGGAFGLDLDASEATWIGDDTVVWAGEGTGVATGDLRR
ncbi:Alpha-amylase GacZ1 OS=Streptomyces glaucescens OX=1907 GN=gacZ1 PE=4 SV=2 [Streptomyces glaucescens]